MKLYLFPLILAFCYGSALAQSVSTLMGARAQGLAYSSAALFDNWSMFNNMAGLAKTEQPIACFAYDLRSAMPGADRIAAGIAYPIKEGVIGGGVFRFGDNLYNESILTAGFSNQLGLAALGARINYIQYRAEGFGSKGVFTLSVGGIAEITPKILVGAYIINLNQPVLSDDDRLPTILTAGVAFKPIEKVLIASELEKNLDYDAIWKMGIEYQTFQKFWARTGYSINPNAAYFGLGFKTSRFTLDYALQHNTLLSFGHQASVNYVITK